MIVNTVKKTYPTWFSELSRFTRSHTGKALWQLVNTIIPFMVLWVVMVYLIMQDYSYWFVLGIALLTGGLQVRIFIFFHDSCHGSFFSTRKANRVVGYITGILTFTPFEEWRRLHNLHHATSGDLDRRGIGDIWTMTVVEYKAASRGRRIIYRIFRNPLVLFGLGPIFLFLFSMRIAHKESKTEERRSVVLTNTILLFVVAILSWLMGFTTYLMIQIPVLVFAGMIGIWLFYIQHQFEDAYWTRSLEWDFLDSALSGSSYYKLPGILQWLTGNIGFHHIHHLRPRIPNYNLQKCHDSIQVLREVQPLTIGKSIRSIRLNLWDEEVGKMVSFAAVK